MKKNKFRIQDHDVLHHDGFLCLFQIPFETEEEFIYWWLPERDKQGRIIREPRMSHKEKARYQSMESHNTLTAGGRNVILTQIGSTSSPPLFSAYFGVGSGFTPTTSPLDIALNSEYFRKQPAGFVTSGSQVDISIYFGISEGVGTMTNCGFWGGTGVSATLGTGTLCTHAQFAYAKQSIPVTVDYVIVQN